MQKRHPSPVIRKMKCSFLDYIQLLMIGQAEQSDATKVEPKCKKRPFSSQSKNKILVFGLHATSDDWLRLIQSTKVNQNVKKRPLSSHQKMKCLFLDYVQLLMISQANLMQQKLNPKCKKGPSSPGQKMKCSFLNYIQLLMIGHEWSKLNKSATKMQNKRPPKSSKNKMLVFGLCSTSDDQPSNLSNKSLTKMQKRPPSHGKVWNRVSEKFWIIFRLLHDQLSKSEQQKLTNYVQRKAPLSHLQKMKCSFVMGNVPIGSTSDNWLSDL